VFVGRARTQTASPTTSFLVALKRARPLGSSPPRGCEPSMEEEALVREAALASRLRHPNIVGVIDVDMPDSGGPTLVLTYVEGCTLADLLARTHLDPRITIRVLIDCARGLAAAHRLGIVHRDVTPSNVLVGRDGIARLSDFGVARLTDECRDPAESGILRGKPAYMAPEYVAGAPASALSDLFSLAVVAWESLVGARLFRGENASETLNNILGNRAPRPSSRRRALFPVDHVVLRALSRSPYKRYPSVDAFADALESAATTHGLLGTRPEVMAIVDREFGAELDRRRDDLRRRIAQPHNHHHHEHHAEPQNDKRARHGAVFAFACAAIASLAVAAATSAPSSRSVPPKPGVAAAAR
jgi:eukaryotic-like serine/threonine-protein kinase